jgi:hypothetical protein
MLTRARPLILLATLLPGLATAQVFEPFAGADGVQQGTGGTLKKVGDVDVWTVGTPPCRYQVLGYVHDTRRRLDLFGLAGTGRIEADVAKVARAHGGEAVYLVSSESKSIGSVGAGAGGSRETASVSGRSVSVRGAGVSIGLGADIRKTESHYVVLKCLADDASPAIVPPADGGAPAATPPPTPDAPSTAPAPESAPPPAPEAPRR